LTGVERIHHFDSGESQEIGVVAVDGAAGLKRQRRYMSVGGQIAGASED